MVALANLKNAALETWTNMRGWRTRRKLVVFESDDWGATRMPSQEAYEKLRKAGIFVDRSPYNRLDCLEAGSDFQALMNVLDAHRDGLGQSARFTMNTVMGNPDFDAIRKDEFQIFHHEHFFDSYKYYHGEDLEPLWRTAMEAGLIRPQFHGREHLNVRLWLRDLQAGNPATLAAFDHHFYGLTTKTSSKRQASYLAAYWTESLEEVDVARSCLEDGLRIFRNTFGFDSRSFIACNYVFPQELETVLTKCGVGLMQGQRGQIQPHPVDGSVGMRRSFTGQRTYSGLVCSVRNVQFEPYKDDSVDWVRRAMGQIAQAFQFGKPAIITTHRINYSGGLSISHRNNCLHLLDSLLTEITTRWPDASFLDSEQLLKEMTST